MRLLTVLAAALLLSACVTDKPLMGTRGLKQPSANNPDKKVCQRSHDLGSNKVVRECHTQAEWAEMAKAGRGTLNGMDRAVTAANSNQTSGSAE
jgi:hypothetical protein